MNKKIKFCNNIFIKASLVVLFGINIIAYTTLMGKIQKKNHKSKYSDDSLIRTRLFPPKISGLTSFPDYRIAQVRTLANF